MKPIYLYTVITILLLILTFQTCQPEPSPVTPINTDSLANIAYNKGYEIAKLEQIGKVKEDTVKSTVIRWKVLKSKVDTIHDTIVKQVVKTADEVITTQADYIEHLKFTSAKQDTLIGLWIDTHKADSTNNKAKDKMISDTVKYFGKRVRKGYIKGFIHGFTTGNITGGVVVGSLRR